MPSAPIAKVVQMMLTTRGSPVGVPSPNAFRSDGNDRITR